MTTPKGQLRAWLLASEQPLSSTFDVALLDLDGTVYVGAEAVPGAPETVEAWRRAGGRAAFVTNNASRTPSTVADHLTTLGVACAPEEVVTAAQAGAALVARRVASGAKVLVVGGAGVREALSEVGLQPVASMSEGPVAVLQGWTPELAWPQLAEGAYALAAGLPWIVTNTDLTLPTARGIAPGNGSFVALLAGTTGRSPDEVAGKPAAPLLEQAVERTGALRPLVVGDRLDTDIEGATTVRLPSLLVLTGVTDLAGLLGAAPARRPSYLSTDLSGLLRAHREPQPQSSAREPAWSCGGWIVSASSPDGLVIAGHGDGRGSTASRDDLLRASCAAIWTAVDEGRGVSIAAAVVAIDAATA